MENYSLHLRFFVRVLRQGYAPVTIHRFAGAIEVQIRNGTDLAYATSTDKGATLSLRKVGRVFVGFTILIYNYIIRRVLTLLLLPLMETLNILTRSQIYL